MAIQIKLDKNNKSLLYGLTLALFPNFKSISIKRKKIFLKRKWYSFEVIEFDIVDFIFLKLTKALNEKASTLGLEDIYPTFIEIYDAVSYFENYDNIIYQIYSDYNSLLISIDLEENITSDSITLTKEQVTIKIVDSMLENIKSSIKHFDIYDLLVTNINNLIDTFVNKSVESTVKLIPIRGSPLIRTAA